MHPRELKDTALLIGYNPEGVCVYSSQMPLGDYWDGEHPWDTGAVVQHLRLEKVRGYLFDSTGELMQEFESFFDLTSGLYRSGWVRHADGSLQEHAA
jgi:hypothetical protein